MVLLFLTKEIDSLLDFLALLNGKCTSGSDWVSSKWWTSFGVLLGTLSNLNKLEELSDALFKSVPDRPGPLNDEEWLDGKLELELLGQGIGMLLSFKRGSEISSAHWKKMYLNYFPLICATTINLYIYLLINSHEIKYQTDRIYNSMTLSPKYFSLEQHQSYVKTKLILDVLIFYCTRE